MNLYKNNRSLVTHPRELKKPNQMKTQTNTTKKNLKDFTVKELEALGITNTWKGHILAYQRLRLFETAKAKGLI